MKMISTQTQVMGLIGALIVSIPFFMIIDLIIKILIKKSSRPSEITTLCAILVFGFLIRLSRLPHLTLLSLLVNSGVGIIEIIGIWKMKKWATILYISLTVIIQIVYLLQGRWIIMELILLLPIGILLYFYKKMK